MKNNIEDENLPKNTVARVNGADHLMSNSYKFCLVFSISKVFYNEHELLL